MPDSGWWDDIQRGRDETKSLNTPKPAKERLTRALQLLIAYQRSKRAVDPEYSRLLELIRDPRKVALWTGHDDRQRLLRALEHYIGYAKARRISESEIAEFQRLAEEIRCLDE